ncbi:hypothetical protein C7967_11525 [Thalassospira sp. 11-3]|nr:hypothetical protein C7967_11525 [Thalassospira sp. 11-3]
MKTTLKEYNEKSQEKSELRRSADNARYSQDYTTYHELTEKVKELDQAYFDKLDTVSVSYWIGGRSYYQDVVKIGKAYFCHGRKMTKGNGYRFIEEIPEITDKMAADMMADSYYY